MENVLFFQLVTEKLFNQFGENFDNVWSNLAEIVDSSISLIPSGTEALLSCWGDAESEAAVGRGVCEDVEDHNDDLAQRQPPPIQVKGVVRFWFLSFFGALLKIE